MAEKTKRQEILEILQRGESWIDKKRALQYTKDNMHELPTDAEFATADSSEGKKAMSALDEQLFALMQEKEALMRAMGQSTESAKTSTTSAKVAVSEPGGSAIEEPAPKSDSVEQKEESKEEPKATSKK